MPPATASVPTIVEIDVSEVGHRPDAIREIFDRQLLAIVVKGVFPAELLAVAIERINRGEVQLPETHVPVFEGPVLGRPLVTSAGDLVGYLGEAERFRAGCAALFGERPTVEARIQQVLHALAGDRPVSIPAASGRAFTGVTMRVLLDGDRLPLHFENSTFDNPVMAELNATLDRSTLMSFYVPMALPSTGGELRIYDVDCLGEASGLIGRMGGDDAARPYFEARWNTVLRPEIGDLLVFDGGRYYHEVTRVGGAPCWTMGGFFAFSRDHRAVHFWS